MLVICLLLSVPVDMEEEYLIGLVQLSSLQTKPYLFHDVSVNLSKIINYQHRTESASAEEKI